MAPPRTQKHNRLPLPPLQTIKNLSTQKAAMTEASAASVVAEAASAAVAVDEVIAQSGVSEVTEVSAANAALLESPAKAKTACRQPLTKMAAARASREKVVNSESLANRVRAAAASPGVNALTEVAVVSAASERLQKARPKSASLVNPVNPARGAVAAANAVSALNALSGQTAKTPKSKAK